MPTRQSFLDRFLEHVEAIDSDSVQAYILRLARDRGFFETIFNAVEEGIMVIDRRLRILYHNRAAKEMLGLPEDTGALRLSQFIRGVDWRRLLREDVEEWARLARQEVEITYPVHRVIQFYLAPHDADHAMATVILRDVTESRRHAEEALHAGTSQAITMLAAQVAHEIGNPLNSLSLNLQLLERDVAAGSPQIKPDEMLSMLQSCRQEVERLDHLISRFLQAIRPGCGALVALDVRELVIETLKFMRQEIELRAVKVKCDFPEALPRINGDLEQLKQALYNILRNALQAMPKGGEIEISCEADADVLILRICDHGNGIGAEAMHELFKPFKTSKVDGNGIGMMIIERVCREHGATLAVDSHPGEGTCVSITFPLRAKPMNLLEGP